MTGCLKGGLLRWMACQNPHPLIDPSRPLEGEVVLRETLSHKPALLCATHGAYAPWVAAVSSSMSALHPILLYDFYSQLLISLSEFENEYERYEHVFEVSV